MYTHLIPSPGLHLWSKDRHSSSIPGSTFGSALMCSAIGKGARERGGGGRGEGA